MKYYSYTTTFLEVPDEIALSLEISNCPHQCPNCHSPILREDVGVKLTTKEIDKLLKTNSYITCICFMGGDKEHSELYPLCDHVHKLGLKTAMYSGDDKIDLDLIPYLDYYKVGSYQEKRGPLDSKTTNQRFYKIENGKLIDITGTFQRR